jgi:glycosyltransferase involved in cell wall biosynthesis
MRVTHIITRLIVGGAQENTLYSVLGLREKPGVEIELISGPTMGSEGSLEPQAKAIPGLLTIQPNLVRPVRPWRDWIALQQLTHRLREIRPDIVHTHSGKAGVVGRLAAARAGVPLIIHTIHGPSFGAFQGKAANLLFCAAERHAARVTTHFVTVADAMRQQYLNAGIGVPAQYTTIWSGFNLDPFLQATNNSALRARIGLHPDDIVVGKVARLAELKGHDDLVEAAPDLARAEPRIRFLLVGDGPFRDRLQARVRELGLAGRFFFTGLVDPNSVASYVGVMDLLVHLSTREGLPRALPQALAAAKPVLAYDCDGAGEVCLENETGFLVKPGQSKVFRERVLLLARDPVLRHRLGQAGQALVRTRFSVQKMVDDLYELYVRLMGEKTRGRLKQAAPTL